MSRLKRFTHSLLSSYALVGTNVLYTLISVPLALKYLSEAEFGLWALTLQVAGYVALIDLGMGSSVARILIDHKDDRANGRYGGVIKSGFLVGLAQGAICLVVGMSLVWFLGGWLKVRVDLRHDFLWLMIGQVVLTAATFLTRMFVQILFAWQRMDVSNYSGIVQLVIGLAVMWMGFAVGLGVFSLLAGAVASWVCGVTISFVACRRLGFWPQPGEWGPTSREQFRELFSYGADVFLITLGGQLITSSQTILVSRQLGLEAAALWSVMTKAFTVASQAVWRIISYAMPALAEMMVRKENDRLWERYRSLFITVSVGSGISAVLFAACNRLFVQVWTHGQFTWSETDDILLGVWMIVSAQQCCHNSLIITLKEIRGLKYIFLVEGLVFAGVALAVLPSTGVTGMLVCSVVATVLFTEAAGVWRVSRAIGGRLKALLWDWQTPLFRVLGVMAPCWLVMEWLLGGTPVWARLLVNGCVLSLVGAFAALRFALPRQLTLELLEKLPGPIQRPAFFVTRCVCGRSYGGA